MKTNVAATSIEAYHGAAGALARCAKAVYLDIVDHPNTTRREIGERVGMDNTSISGRVYDLREEGYIVEDTVGRKCKISGKRAKTLSVSTEA